MLDSSKSRSTLWAQVCGLAAVQGAITLTWVIYTLYLPQLLGQFGFPKGLAAGILVAESLAGVVLEPVMGGLSDRAYRWMGSRFPMISLGVILAAVLFMLIPTIALARNFLLALSWVLPGAMIAWAFAMTIFRSPVLALLGRYAFETQLPQAASILTFVGAVTGLLGMVTTPLLLSFGPGITFGIGSLVLLAAVAILGALNPQATVQPAQPQTLPLKSKISGRSLGLIFGTGAGIALGGILLRTVLKASSPVFNTQLIFVFIVAHILTVVPAGILAGRWGNRIAMLFGVGGLAGGLGLLLMLHQTPLAGVVVLCLGAAFSLAANGSIPFALSLMPPSKAGLGVGTYFGGGALAGGLFGLVAPVIASMPVAIAASVGAIAFLGAGSCIALSKTPQPQ